jgi:hypothetical protein
VISGPVFAAGFYLKQLLPNCAVYGFGNLVIINTFPFYQRYRRKRMELFRIANPLTFPQRAQPANYYKFLITFWDLCALQLTWC